MVFCDLLSWFEHSIFAIVITILLTIWYSEGAEGVISVTLKAVKRGIPGVKFVLNRVLSGEVRSFTAQIKHDPEAKAGAPRVQIPENGVPKEELLVEMKKLKESEINPEDGKIFAYVYTMEGDTFELQKKAFDFFSERTGLDPDHDQLVKMFHQAFMHENALNPAIFPSLRKFENEVISMTASMMNGDEHVVGSLTSGGTESILMAMKTYRDRAHHLFPHIKHPQMVAPITIHPAHMKAAHYFGFEIIRVPIESNFQPNVEEFEKAITPNTIALLASAPQYCHGIVDPIPEISEIAVRRQLPLHVDACFGGFMLPWVEKVGYKVPVFDFRNNGVTSISADIHKYGFGAKGASVILYKDAELRKYQIFAYSEWPGGLFGSPTMAGTRPGGNIAASWVTLRAIGQDGYKKIATTLMDTTKKLKEGITAIPGLKIMGKPHMTAFAIGSESAEIDILAVADVLEKKGWKPERQQNPACLHCTIMPHHVPVADSLLVDLREATEQVKDKKTINGGSAAMYGMVAKIPDKTIVDDFIVEFFSQVYTA